MEDLKNMDIQKFTSEPNVLWPFYKDFDVRNRLLFTGHSHQAWPDVAKLGILKAYELAAKKVDDKWGEVYEVLGRIKQGYSDLLNDSSGHYTIAANTHELLVKFLSALAYKSKNKILTTDGEFHTIRRQMDRLEEEGIEVCRFSAKSAKCAVEQLIENIDSETLVVLISSVFFKTGEITPGLKELQFQCERSEVPLVVDVYHHLNVVPFDINQLGLESSYLIGGGYKYCQFGEGVCFLRSPKNCELRPVITGWFAEMELLEKTPLKPVSYPDSGERFAGSTFDCTSIFRANEVMKFFKEHKLSPSLLRKINQHQISLLIKEFEKINMDKNKIYYDSDINLEDRGGFLSLYSPLAPVLQKSLLEMGVQTDCRENILRFGPAPYISDEQIILAMSHLKDVLKKV